MLKIAYSKFTVGISAPNKLIFGLNWPIDALSLDFNGKHLILISKVIIANFTEMLLDQPITKELFAAPTQIATMSIASKTTTTTTTKTTTRKKHLPVNPDWSPCVTCGGGRQWPSYCRGWLCRRRWPYHQQYPSPRRCYSCKYCANDNPNFIVLDQGSRQEKRRYSFCVDLL